ncbi:hypothetical protein SKAU_G00184640 [Synaphobranchus kaupii]|uniref:Uncharacterized protein n=1 Tax=Synaphobranchus kaupii TaxID=118154 RepID=A0A9Q1FCR6_SYNKA|nr:hypothetical protein SKAU_G00184640 [Synaphobranchus kaupii]
MPRPAAQPGQDVAASVAAPPANQELQERKAAALDSLPAPPPPSPECTVPFALTSSYLAARLCQKGTNSEQNCEALPLRFGIYIRRSGPSQLLHTWLFCGGGDGRFGLKATGAAHSHLAAVAVRLIPAVRREVARPESENQGRAGQARLRSGGAVTVLGLDGLGEAEASGYRACFSERSPPSLSPVSNNNISGPKTDDDTG